MLLLLTQQHLKCYRHQFSPLSQTPSLKGINAVTTPFAGKTLITSAAFSTYVSHTISLLRWLLTGGDSSCTVTVGRNNLPDRIGTSTISCFCVALGCEMLAQFIVRVTDSSSHQRHKTPSFFRVWSNRLVYPVHQRLLSFLQVLAPQPKRKKSSSGRSSLSLFPHISDHPMMYARSEQRLVSTIVSFGQSNYYTLTRRCGISTGISNILHRDDTVWEASESA
jgi:hypothetical protein